MTEQDEKGKDLKKVSTPDFETMRAEEIPAKVKTSVLDEAGIDRSLTRIAHEILERNLNPNKLALIGIQKRGVFLAQRIAKKINEIEKVEVPVGALDISFYRDDLAFNPRPKVYITEISFDINEQKIVLVDDVLYTGRTIRAALDALTDFGRPSLIQLAVLIDRGHRELPIRPDYVGKNVPTSRREVVHVNLKEVEDADNVVILEEHRHRRRNET